MELLMPTISDPAFSRNPVVTVQTEASLFIVSPLSNFPFMGPLYSTLWMSVLCSELSPALHQALFPPLAIGSFCLYSISYSLALVLLWE